MPNTTWYILVQDTSVQTKSVQLQPVNNNNKAIYKSNNQEQKNYILYCCWHPSWNTTWPRLLHLRFNSNKYISFNTFTALSWSKTTLFYKEWFLALVWLIDCINCVVKVFGKYLIVDCNLNMFNIYLNMPNPSLTKSSFWRCLSKQLFQLVVYQKLTLEDLTSQLK